MRILVASMILLFSSHALAQVDDCPTCVIGIYDDAQLSHGSDGVTNLEFSVDGIAPFCDGTEPGCFGFDGLTPPQVTIGSRIDTPNDESGGGLVMSWNTCLSGNRALVRLDLVSHAQVPDDVVLVVRRRFPPSRVDTETPAFGQCDGVRRTYTRATGGCYVLNPTGKPGDVVGDPPCKLDQTTAVAAVSI